MYRGINDDLVRVALLQVYIALVCSVDVNPKLWTELWFLEDIRETEAFHCEIGLWPSV